MKDALWRARAMSWLYVGGGLGGFVIAVITYGIPWQLTALLCVLSGMNVGLGVVRLYYSCSTFRNWFDRNVLCRIFRKHQWYTVVNRVEYETQFGTMLWFRIQDMHRKCSVCEKRESK